MTAAIVGLTALVLGLGVALVVSYSHERTAINERFAADLRCRALQRINEDLRMRLDDMSVELAKSKRLRSLP